MKLKRFRVKDFRSVIDSGWINCDEVTTLVGINESGKSNILLALWKLNPARGGEIDLLHDLPVKKLADLRERPDETSFIEAVFELDDSAKRINDTIKSSFVPDDELILNRFYSGRYHLGFCNDTAQKKLENLQKTKKTKDGEKLGLTDESIVKAVIPFVPSFVYYSNYGNLTSRIYLPHAVRWLNGGHIDGVDIKEDQVRTIRVLFDYVNLEPQEILDLGQDAKDLARQRGSNVAPTADDIKKAEENKERRSLLLQSAGTKLTNDFRNWWKQGEYKFRFGADGDYFYIWVSDEKRPEEVDLGLRSTGLQWFLSFFLIFLMECKSENKGSVLLLDEAGLTLHPLAQKNLAEFFNRLATDNQIINTTHSPFIVEAENLDRCRVVYTDNYGGTIVSENLREGSGEIGEKSIYAVHAALGLTVSDVMLQGSQVVIVEGVADQFYLSALKNALIRERKLAPKREIVFAPAGGAKGVQGVSSLVSSVYDGLPMVVLDSDKAGNEFKKKLENGLYKDCKNRIISIEEITGIEQSEIEDLIPFPFIANSVARILGVQDEGDEFEPEEGKALIPQIEKYAQSRGITLKDGWKVSIAKAFKKTLLGRKPKNIPDEYLTKWNSLFTKLDKE